jgi:outer membrane protein OmpA-like peptidoglycan-associated protein
VRQALLVISFTHILACTYVRASEPAPEDRAPVPSTTSVAKPHPEDAAPSRDERSGAVESTSAGTTSAPPPPTIRAPEFPDRIANESLDRMPNAAWSWDRGFHRASLTLPSDDLFEPGTAVLTPHAELKLGVLAAALSRQFGRTIFVRSHTDSLGDPAQGVALSQRRANAICENLALKGVPREWLRPEGLGASHPVDDNRTPWGRAANRRIEMVVVRVP